MLEALGMHSQWLLEGKIGGRGAGAGTDGDRVPETVLQ